MEVQDNFSKGSDNHELSVDQNHHFSFLTLIDLLIDYKKLIITILSVAVFSSILYYLIAPSVYTASILVTPIAETGSLTQGNGLNKVLSGFRFESSKKGYLDVESNLAILRSRQFITAFIKENRINEFFIPEYQIRQRFKILRLSEQSLEEKAYKNFLKAMRISAAGDMITISISINNKERVASITNQFIDSANQYIKTKVINETKKNISFIEEKLSNTSLVNLQTSFYNLIEKEIQRSMMANGRDDYAFMVIDSANPPTDRSHPRILPALVASLIFSSIIGIFIIFIHTFYIQKFKKT